MSFMKKIGRGIKEKVEETVEDIKEKKKQNKEYKEAYDKEFREAYHKERIEAEKEYARKKAREDIKAREKGKSDAGVIKFKNPAEVKLLDDDWENPLDHFANLDMLNPTAHHKKRGEKNGRRDKHHSR